jgi:phosphate transport system protein
MPRLLQREIDKLKKQILSLGADVEESVRLAVRAIAARDADLAREVIEGDVKIDEQEVALEEECLKILALHQPVADDLRFIVAVLKINNDLERIGDLAGHLAERARSLSRVSAATVPPDLLTMAERVQTMLSKSLDALVNLDMDAALFVCNADDAVDDIHRSMYRRTKAGIRQSPESLDWLLQLLSASRYLERIADQTTNIAEDVIYLIGGDIIRHRGIGHRNRLSDEEDLPPETKTP